MITIPIKVSKAKPAPIQYRAFLAEKDLSLLADNPIAKNEIIDKKHPRFAAKEYVSKYFPKETNIAIKNKGIPI